MISSGAISTDQEIYETDVLVIGGGLAGLRAAITAREAGARVMLAVKGKPGRSGCSAMTTAGYAAAMPEADPADGPELWAADTLKGGAGICDEALVEIMCQEGAAWIHDLEALGGRFERSGADYRRAPSGEHSRPRVLVTENHIGIDLTVPLAARAAELGVIVPAPCMALRLVTDGRGVAGAVLMDLKTGACFAVAARAVVIATGGAGRLFAMTSNPNGMTGDGFALAAAAGARLRDMEFIQFYPWRCIDPFDKARVSIQPSTFVLGGRLYNSEGERFMVAFNPDGAEATTRDVAARGIYDQMRRGLGVRGGVRLDLSALSAEDFARSNPKVARYCAAQGIDHASYPFILTPEAHFWMGGIAIDSDGATSLPGLFAAGEVAGGVHGANRLNSNALPETQVFGARAGRAAAGMAGGEAGKAVLADALLQQAASAGMHTQLPAIEIATRLDALRAIMWKSLGIIRDAGGMQRGLSYVQNLSQDLAGCDAEPQARRALHELAFLAATAELSLRSALFRRESRGAHFRNDFPLTDPGWRGSVIVGQAEARIETTFLERLNDAA
ncbi:FAD-dependent oxidoreductase [Bosea sp. BH3]|uniref:FAD-dependent oxidoreductase n=1 Tax=Bosea sp. BH3 TaxID=2871701 RepID=UPI0021CB2DBC|nr:FAD-dependent oxidoreductase [Bosea sp. BH3]MCU4180399.1 FAD-binding protein [Bosea sp. BH3]